MSEDMLLRNDVLEIRRLLGIIGGHLADSKRLLEQLVAQKPEPAETMEKQIKRAIAAKLQDGGRVEEMHIHAEDWQELADSLEARGLRPEPYRIKGDDGVTETRVAITLATSAGMVAVLASREVAKGSWHFAKFGARRP